MTTLVTGAGLIGRLTAEMLLSAGERVVLIDVRDQPSNEIGREGHLIYRQCDVTDLAALIELSDTHGVNRIVHTAAMLSTSTRREPLEAFRVNTMGTACVVE